MDENQKCNNIYDDEPLLRTKQKNSLQRWILIFTWPLLLASTVTIIMIKGPMVTNNSSTINADSSELVTISTTNIKHVTTKTTQKSPTSTTTVTSASTGFAVLVGVGLTTGDSPLYNIEVVDILRSNSTCDYLQNVPSPMPDALGGLGNNNNPQICYVNCFSFQRGSWKIISSLNTRRSYTGAVGSPFNDGSKLFVAGGLNIYSQQTLNSTEVLSDVGWQPSVPLPISVAGHCTVMKNPRSVMVIGGLVGENQDPSGRTFSFDANTNEWSEESQLIEPRYFFSCAMIKKDKQRQEKSVIVVGGASILIIPSTEVLDLGSSEWRSGPVLPIGIAYSSLVEDPLGGVVLIGGYSGNNEYLKTLYRLSDAGPDAKWEEMTQKLKAPRAEHTSFPISNKLATCK